MAPPTPDQLRWRRRFELLIKVMQPGLDIVLAAGERISRTVDRSPDEPIPAIRFPDEVRPLGPGPRRTSR
jgi:hypothetical protein